MLAASEEEDIAAIACFDIGEFARNYPGGRLVAKRLGAKDVVMKLIDHENPDLRRQALLCVSKLMVQNWQVRKPSQLYHSHADAVSHNVNLLNPM